MHLGAPLRPGRHLRGLAALAVLGALLACNDDPTSSDPCATSRAATVRLGQTVTGNLASSDCHLPDGSYGDLYKVTVGAGQTVNLTMASSAFDAYLVLNDASGTEVASTGPDAGTGEAFLSETLGAGTYYIIANSVAAGGTGSYTLRVAAGCGTSGASTIAVGGTVNGTLATTDCELVDGTYADVYRLTLGSSQNVRIDLSSTAFDSFIFLWDSNGNAIDAADAGGTGDDARLFTSLPAGTYYVVANAYNVGETGPYTLSVQASSNAPCTLSSATAATLGSTINGSLSNTDCVLQDGSYADVYRFDVATQHSVQIDMASASVNSYLLLIDGAGNGIAQNDNGGGGNDARIVMTLAPGTYYAVANSFSPGEAGTYTLTFSP